VSAAALPWQAVTRARRAGAVAPRGRLAFGPPGVLVAICGLHGGAGTTALTGQLAAAAASASGPGRVLAVEADARAADLAARLGAASRLALCELAAARLAGRVPEAGVVAERADGLRVLAAARPRAAEAPPAALGALLAEARAGHGLCVIDAGCLRAAAAEPALAGADVVIWAADPARLAPGVLASPLVRPARGARWVLALVPVAGDGRISRSGLRTVREDLDAVVRIPRGAPADARRAHEAAERLARAVRA
jgi:hypothetical protein